MLGRNRWIIPSFARKRHIVFVSFVKDSSNIESDWLPALNYSIISGKVPRKKRYNRIDPNNQLRVPENWRYSPNGNLFNNLINIIILRGNGLKIDLTKENRTILAQKEHLSLHSLQGMCHLMLDSKIFDWNGWSERCVDLSSSSTPGH